MKARIAVVILFLAVTFVSCDRIDTLVSSHLRGEGDQNLFSNSDIFHVFSIQQDWAVYRDSAIAPSEAEKADWLNTRRNADGLVKHVLSPEYFEYSDAAINGWIEKGDPVAMYLKAFQLYSRYGCKATGEIVPLLEKSYAVESDEYYVFEGKRLPEKRVPEAALALYHLAQVCPRTHAMKTPAMYREMAKQGGMVAFHYTIPYKE